ncbi:MAG: tail fiber domain-containing protein [Telluria sp.]|nr:tail fiber domain-containing protein [Telluria sp.]
MQTHDAEVAQPVAEGADPRKPYVTPVLKVYGAVRDLTLGTGTTNGDSGALSMAVGSDPALKENVVRLGTHPLGIGLYLFDYKPEFQARWGHGRRFGVMANEVEAVMPEAVFRDENGYRTVDYAMLGVVLH